MLLEAQGKLEEAEVLSRRALKGKERVLGTDHPSTLLTMYNLAALLEQKGDLSSAVAFRLHGVGKHRATSRQRVLLA